MSNNLVLLDQELYTQSLSVKTHPCLFKFKLPLMKNENFLYITNLVLSLTKWRCSFLFISYSLDSRKIKVLSRGWWHKANEDFLKLSVSMTCCFSREPRLNLQNLHGGSQPSITPVLGLWKHRYKSNVQTYIRHNTHAYKIWVFLKKKLKSRSVH